MLELNNCASEHVTIPSEQPVHNGAGLESVHRRTPVGCAPHASRGVAYGRMAARRGERNVVWAVTSCTETLARPCSGGSPARRRTSSQSSVARMPDRGIRFARPRRPTGRWPGCLPPIRRRSGISPVRRSSCATSSASFRWCSTPERGSWLTSARPRARRRRRSSSRRPSTRARASSSRRGPWSPVVATPGRCATSARRRRARVRDAPDPVHGSFASDPRWACVRRVRSPSGRWGLRGPTICWATRHRFTRRTFTAAGATRSKRPGTCSARRSACSTSVAWGSATSSAPGSICATSTGTTTALNKARREFFRRCGIERRPASTGVQGMPFPEAHDFSMRLHAVKSSGPLEDHAMSTPALNEAWSYGADFSRGLRLAEANKVTLYVSGTASIDEAGRTVHAGNFEAQADRMLDNIASLLAQQGATFENLVSGVTYLKNPSDAPMLQSMCRQRGFDGFPCALVEAALCRPELLCETEAVAMLSPATQERSRAKCPGRRSVVVPPSFRCSRRGPVHRRLRSRAHRAQGIVAAAARTKHDCRSPIRRRARCFPPRALRRPSCGRTRRQPVSITGTWWFAMTAGVTC